MFGGKSRGDFGDQIRFAQEVHDRALRDAEHIGQMATTVTYANTSKVADRGRALVFALKQVGFAADSFIYACKHPDA